MPNDLKRDLECIPKYILSSSNEYGIDDKPLIEETRSDRFGIWVKYEDLENIIKKIKED